MQSQRRVVFFGASVTEQDAHHATGELTGYVTWFQRHLAEGWEVHRISAGSSNITDAAVVYVERVIGLEPDLCVLDWATPALTECDPRLVRQIYYRLLAHGILPVTAIFPRKDRDQRSTPLVKEMEAVCREFGLPFWDAGPLVAERGIDSVLRDVVHTTTAGARLYAEALAGLLAEHRDTPAPACDRPAPFEVIELDSATPVPGHFTRLFMTNRGPADEDLEFSLVMEQRVGPYSPLLDGRVTAGETQRRLPVFPVWDPWCWRELQCIKAITDWYRGPLSRLELTVSPADPPYAEVPQASPVPLAERNLKQRGKLFLLIRSGSQARMIYRCDNPRIAPAASEAAAQSADPESDPALVAEPAADETGQPCILHLGIGTTGNSVLHRSLEAARAVLRHRGLAYPEDILPNGRTGGDNHKCLAVAAMPEGADNIVLRQHQALTRPQRAAFNQRVRDHYRRLAEAEAETAGPGPALPWLLSAEHFWSCLTRAEDIARLAALMAEAGLRVVRLVIYIQRQADWFEALQHQRLREARELLPLDTALLLTPHMMEQLDYRVLIGKWQAAFPAARVVPRIFTPALDGAALLADFAEATGLPLDGLPPQDSRGGPLRLSNAGVNALLRMNAEFPATLPGGTWNQIRADLLAFLAETLPGNCAMLPAGVKAGIDERFAESNAAVCAAHFPGRARLFDGGAEDGQAEDGQAQEAAEGGEAAPFRQIEDPDFLQTLDVLARSWHLAGTPG